MCKNYKPDKRALVIHFRGKHTGERPFRCDKFDCTKSFTSQAYLSQHEKTHSEIRPFKCDQIGCNKSFKCKPSLSHHKTTHTDIRLFECDQIGCNKAFKTKPSLRQHKKCHLKGKFFKNKNKRLMESRMENHPKTRDREFLGRTCKDVVIKTSSNYLCVKCNKGFHEDTEMVCHLKQVHGTSTIFCDICDERLENEKSRREHIVANHMPKQ